MRRARPTLGVALPPMKEISLHIQAASFMFRAMPPEVIWFHCPNGEVRDKATAGKLKAMGVLPGVFDFGLIWPNGQASWLELKVGDNDLSEEQVKFQDRARANRCGTATAWTLEQVEEILARWCGAYGLKLRASILPRRVA
jgi:hypothetical protein